jgi:hypothetical protein
MRIDKISWIEQVVALIVVFISISAGFLRNEYRAGSFEQDLELKYLLGFQGNIDSNTKNLDEVLEAHVHESEIIKRYVCSMQKKPLGVDSAISILQVMLTNSYLDYQNNTYEDMKNIGNLRMIENYELKEAIELYHANLKNLKMMEDVYYDFNQTFVWPLAIENYDMLNNTFEDENIINSLSFRNTITGYYSLIVQRKNRYQKVYDESKMLNRMLSNEIRSRS